ncbi:hypothetical protein INT47_002450 [Mucor saturninus]|uniref:Uncharacterized protein n=1 Tax=Mucor saturninus TaxID=64648 RepID=A0A8H7RIZ7_9FUNG|nr:hypothetical protein INT47_002450 [Mucor saturninus]
MTKPSVSDNLSPIRLSSDYRAANRARFSCRSPSLCRYPIRSPPPPYNPSPLLYIDHVHRSIVTQVDQFPQSPVAEADHLLHLGIEAYHHPYDTFGQVTPLNLDIHRDYYQGCSQAKKFDTPLHKEIITLKFHIP